MNPLFEKKGYLIALIAFIATFALFYNWTSELLYCLIASIINASIIWGTYLIIRMCYLASR
ncbi:putative uncharacterized protein [Waddlia chondrophila 2032/99]|uniref:Uncharacterized protein n=2 Tax=Waddlia chondrophila TaxID=71667 RepID=D6YWE9_WADCW|nr:hypothetical protein [Waddlia chondrophila]ADI38460.1 hypothetical protein wcw_1103 [Waddlia chondrophila WSU 86-1044]CCB91542.1 putative uncharacterized protein [Waddlia chondrophila 2032/99]